MSGPWRALFPFPAAGAEFTARCGGAGRRTAKTTIAAITQSISTSRQSSSCSSPRIARSWHLRHRQQARLLHALQRVGSIYPQRTGKITSIPSSPFSTYPSIRKSSPSTPPPPPPKGPKALYAEKVKQGLLKEDPRQLIILEDLQEAYDDIVNYKPPPVPEPLEDVTPDQSSSSSSSGGFLSRLFGRKTSSAPPIPPIPEDIPKSLYLFGDVGCGKSMLMDLVSGLNFSLSPFCDLLI